MNLDNKIDYLQDGISIVSLKDRMMVDAPLKTVNSARISYNKQKTEFDEKDSKLTSFLWNNEHTSPFRHSYFTFHIKAPLFLFNQLKKYQVGSGFRSYEVEGKTVSLEVFDEFYDIDKGCSWNEVSGRYTQTSEDFYIPKKLRSNPAHGNKQASETFKEGSVDEKALIEMMRLTSLWLLDGYNLFIEHNVAKEIARMFLPQNIYTECYWTVSLQALLWFLHQRLKPGAQHEIRLLAEGVYTLMKNDLDKLGLKKEEL